MIIGFVGGVRVMDPRQQQRVETRIRELHAEKRVSLIVHAGKQGADVFVHSLALSMGIKVALQRSNLMRRVAHCTGVGVTTLPLQPFFKHNQQICDLSDLVMVAVNEPDQLRTNRATWTAIWYSAPNRPTEIVMPSGRLRQVYSDCTVEPYDPHAPRG